jgi:hypothetical protein
MSFFKENYFVFYRFTHIPVFKKMGVWVMLLYGVSSCALFKPVVPTFSAYDEQVFYNEKEEDVPLEKEKDRKNLIPYWKKKAGDTAINHHSLSNAEARNAIIKEAEKYIGTPYLWAGKTPEIGFDCSGFTSFVMGKFDYYLSPSSKEQAKSGIPVTLEESKPGDLIIFSNEKNEVFHVSFIIRIEPGVIEVIHSVNGGVKKENLFNNSWWMNKKMAVRSILSER